MHVDLLSASAAARYDDRSIALHWITATLIALLWLGGQTVDSLGHATVPLLRSLHISLGLLLAVVLTLRVLWRLTSGRRLPGAGLAHRVAQAGHGLLYLLAGTAVGLGLATAWFRGYAVFGLFAFPGNDRTFAHTLRGLHELAANAILLIALGHAAVALGHHYLLRDGVLRRMLPQL